MERQGAEGRSRNGHQDSNSATCASYKCKKLAAARNFTNRAAMGEAGRNTAPGALAKLVSDDMPDSVAVHSIEEILGRIGCMPPHIMQEMERLGCPLQRRSRFLVRGTFIFELAAQCPPDHIHPIKSET